MNNKVIIGLAGDVMIGRNVNTVITAKGYVHPWGNILPILKGTDVNIINLETTLTNSQQIVDKMFNFKAAPDKVTTLTEAHITAVNLANNHILDYSEEGLTETIDTLDAVHIQHTGAGRNAQEAGQPVMINCHSISLGIAGFTDNEPGWKALPSGSGTNYIDIDHEPDRQKALKIIQQLSQTTDIVIASIHWGPNMKEKPGQRFIELAHDMIEFGATLIHGHSAHIFQGIELYRNKCILYDTGDFVDDYAVNPLLRNDHSFFFVAEADKTGITHLQLIPVLIRQCQVNQATGSDYRWSMLRMQQLSLEFGTSITDEGKVLLSG